MECLVTLMGKIVLFRKKRKPHSRTEMAFINKAAMAKKKADIGIADHPLLKELGNLSLVEKMSYIEGCVFASLMDDEKTDDAERTAIRRLALSLRLSEEEIDQCYETVMALKTDDEKIEFGESVAAQLKREPIPVFLMEDIESLLKKNGEIPAEATDGIDFLGTLIFGDQGWRDVFQKAAKEAEARRRAETGKAKEASTKDSESGKTRKDAPVKGKSEEDVASVDYGFGDKVWRINEEHNGIECSFAGKPSESVRSKLKAAGFRFSGKQGLWYAKDSDKAREAVQSLKLTYVGDPESEDASDDEDAPIFASELIELIETSNIEAAVEDDEECYPVVKSAEFDTYSDGECELKVKYGFPDDGVAGRLVFEVAGVHFSADRNFDGEHEPFEISGREIEYDDDLDEDAVLEAIEDNVSITEFDPDDYDFDEDKVDVDDIVNVLDTWPDYFAVDDSDTVYGYDDEDDIDEDYENLETVDEAVGKMLENGNQVEFEPE